MQVLVPAYDGFEEIETICVVDVLRRSGANVTFASIKPISTQIPILEGQNRIKVICDSYLETVINSPFDMIVLPGGLRNAEALSDHKALISRLLVQREQGKWLAAICASPAIVLKRHGLLEGELATCHPSLQEHIKPIIEKRYLPFPIEQLKKNRVVISNHIITSRSPGTALEFAITLVELLYGTQKAIHLAQTMLIRR